MKGFSPVTYFKLGSILWLIMAFASCFSLGYVYDKLNPGEVVGKVAWIFMQFLSAYFFAWIVKKSKQDEEGFSGIDADKVIKDFESKGKKKLKVH